MSIESKVIKLCISQGFNLSGKGLKKPKAQQLVISTLYSDLLMFPRTAWKRTADNLVLKIQALFLEHFTPKYVDGA